jgi:hypothetical protein
MPPTRPRARTARTVLPVVAGAGLLLLGATGPASAASTRPARLVVTSLSSPPATVAPGTRFTVTGKVRNTGGRSSRALVSLAMRTGRRPTVAYALGGRSIATVRPGRTRKFRVRVVVPKDARGTDSGRPFVVEACAGTSRRARVSCRTARRRAVLRVPAPAAPGPAVPSPPATPAPPAPAPPAPTPADPTTYTPGARTLGDSLFPSLGNGGYDAQHYDLDLRYTDVLTRVLRGTATITAKATQNLSELSFDFQGLAVTAVTVDGVPATHAYDFDQGKLVVTPATGIKVGTTFDVAVTYGGPPSPVIDPDGSREGWLSSIEFGAVALGEPMGSQGWFPTNNVPYDKASYDIAVTTSSDLQAVSNGVLAATTPHGDGTTTYDWRQSEPMAPYLATVSVGDFDTSGTTLDGPRPNYVYVDRSFTNRAAIIANQQRVPGILDFYADYYDMPYPFAASGGIVARVDAGVGYVLETQTKPTYPSANAGTSGAGLGTIAHENAHQWFGNLVTLRQWRDIWLNEGLTEFSSWRYMETNPLDATPAPPTTTARFDAQYASSSESFWNIAPADPPSAADIFDSNAMYTRGAMVASALRQILGEAAFRQTMHDWLAERKHGNGTTEEFIATVKRDDPSTQPDRGARWDAFFREWLYTSYTGSPAAGNRPQVTPANFATFPLD